MNRFNVIFFVTLAVGAFAEPPSGYAYKRPSSGYSSGGHGGYSSGGGSGYQAVSGGYQTSEGQYVDPQLLHKIEEILLQQEQLNGNRGGHGGSFGGGHGHGISQSYGAPSSSYGVPSSSYGVPSYNGGRVVGIELGNVRQGIQVAQFLNQQSGGHGGFSSGGHGGSISQSYSLPSISSSYGAPSRPQSTYGVPH
ncbi:unnamed protein product [Diamesa tonsa]